MARNRFEQVDELQSDAINLTFRTGKDGQVGLLHVPKSATNGQIPIDLNTGEMPADKALIAAIQLANGKKLPIVVLDPEGIWKGEWGDLWRYEDSDEDEGEQGETPKS
jgi:hypothetical protein